MNKRFVTTFLAALMCIVCAFSFSACGLFGGSDGGDSSGDFEIEAGEQVTEEEWKAAFDAIKSFAINETLFNNNFTYNFLYNEYMTAAVWGNSKVNDQEKTCKFKIASNGIYERTIDTMYYEGAVDLRSGQEIYCYRNEEQNKGWFGGRLIDEKTSILNSDYKDYGEWVFSSNSYIDSTFQSVCVGFIISLSYVYGFSADIESQNFGLSDLYSAFTYKNGIYSAKLYHPIHERVLFTVKVALSGGYLTGIECTGTEGSSLTGKMNYYFACAFKDFGTTTVEVPAGLKVAYAAQMKEEENTDNSDIEDIEEE